MADRTYVCQVHHTVTETYSIDASSTTEAAMKLGVHMAVVNDDGETPDDTGVRLTKTAKTLKRATQPRPEIDDDDPRATPGAGD